MAKTQIWSRFGKSILTAPELTLAAFLGHANSVKVAVQHSLAVPQTADFRADSAYDPNIHKLDLPQDYLDSAFLMRCVATWGAEVLIRATHACGLLQCLHHSTCAPQYVGLRNDAAFLLQTLIDGPTPEARLKARECLEQCQKRYRPHEKKPDSKAAVTTWFHLGAPWFALETALGNLAVEEGSDETDPAPSNKSWITRNSVWPKRAIDAAAHTVPHPLLRDTLRSTLIAWATSRPTAGK